MKIKKELTPDGFREYVQAIQSCGDHPLANLTVDHLLAVKEVLDCYIEDAEGYEDTKSRIIVKMQRRYDAPVEYGVFTEWSDSSGHG